MDALSWIWEHWTAEVSLGKYDYTEISTKTYIKMYKNKSIYLHIGDLSVHETWSQNVVEMKEKEKSGFYVLHYFYPELLIFLSKLL